MRESGAVALKKSAGGKEGGGGRTPPTKLHNVAESGAVGISGCLSGREVYDL